MANLKIPMYALVVLNFIFFTLGLALLSAGIWGRIEYNLKSFTDRIGEWETVYIGTYVFIFLGVFCIIMALVGCIGSMMESRPMLLIYFFLVLFLFLAEIGAAIYLFWWTYRDSPLLPLIRKKFDNIMQHYGMETEQGEYWTQRIDWMQDWFDCCGSNGTDDYLSRPYIDQIPKSCRSVHGYVFEIGCGNAMFNHFQRQGYVLGIIGFVVAFCQVFCMALALVMYTKIGGGKARREQQQMQRMKKY